jgi:hypothetical protein
MKVFLLLMAALVRPPALQPGDIPFTYDPNKVTCEILRVFEFEPDPNFIFLMPMKCYDEDGENVVLTCNDPNVWIPTPSMVVDPNGTSISRWVCDVRPGGVERVLYLEFTVTDIPSHVGDNPMLDKRMILINVKKKRRAPTLFWDG